MILEMKSFAELMKNYKEEEHPSGMTYYQAIELIQKQQGVTDAQKRFWMYCLDKCWTTGFAYLSQRQVSYDLAMSRKTVIEAKKFLRLRNLIDVDTSGKIHAVRCIDQIKWLSQQSKDINWKEAKIDSGNEYGVQYHDE